MASFNSEDIFLYRPKVLMKFLGVWVPPVPESVPHMIFRVFMLFMQYLFLIFQSIYIVQIWGDLLEVSQPFYVFFTQAGLCLKITIFHVNIGNVRELLSCMMSDVFRPQCLTHKNILKADATKIKRLLFSFMVGAELTCILWIIVPIFEEVRKFPFGMWMPVSPESIINYGIGYAFQSVTICISAFMYFGVDSVALSMVIFGCSQIKIVKDKVMGISSVAYGLKPKERLKLFSENRKKLVECVIHHQAIATFTQLVEDTFHWYLLFQLTGGVGLTCMCALWSVADEEHPKVAIASNIIYVVVMLTQLYICCWSGHELTANSENLHTIMYECMWYEQDVRFKRDLCFAMMRMSRPMVVRAGHYINMSRQTFVSVLRMSYSYFAVLNQVK
uniref:Odorant receptor n=1 Tax=Glyphodes pyloalis TaxID=1242752 RepID=A0A6M3GUH2_GLYPY|nr:olfactory receptor [Glyphodes pyloalis]